jgi:hypothetical protein
VDDLPDFLRIPQDERRAAWLGRRLTKPSARAMMVTRNEDATTRAFRKEMEKQAAKKKAERFKLLRERYGKN